MATKNTTINPKVNQVRRQSEQAGSREIQQQEQRMAALREEQLRRLLFAQRRPA